MNTNLVNDNRGGGIRNRVDFIKEYAKTKPISLTVSKVPKHITYASSQKNFGNSSHVMVKKHSQETLLQLLKHDLNTS